MLRENPVLKKMIATGEERMSKLASNLLSNEKLMGALQKTVSVAMVSLERSMNSLHLRVARSIVWAWHGLVLTKHAAMREALESLKSRDSC